jgi:hypothetical protein
MEINSLSTIQLVTEGSSMMHIPPRYHSNSYFISTSDSVIKFTCTADSQNMKCQKSKISASGLFDIYFLSFKIYSNNLVLTPINEKLLVYSNSIDYLIKRKQFNCICVSIGCIGEFKRQFDNEF